MRTFICCRCGNEFHTDDPFEIKTLDNTHPSVRACDKCLSIVYKEFLQRADKMMSIMHLMAVVEEGRN